MHEAGIAQQVIETCLLQLQTHGTARATCVGLRIGALSGVDPEALRFCFDALKPDTLLESATLDIEWRSRFGCACLHADGRAAGPPGTCPSCGATESFDDATALDITYLDLEEGADR
jgi:hydrogenase nickel incorporation protein HypA/HybF